MAREPRAPREVYHAAQPSGGMFFRNDIDDTHVALRVVLSRGRGDDLDVLNLSGRDLLQSLCPRKDAGFAIYINQEPAAATESNRPFGIDPHRRRVFEDIHCRAAARHHVRRCFHDLFV